MLGPSSPVRPASEVTGGPVSLLHRWDPTSRSSARNPRVLLGLVGLAVTLLTVVGLPERVIGAQPATSAPAIAGVPMPAAVRTTAESGSSRVVTFSLPPAPEDRVINFTSTDPNIVSVLSQGQIEANRSVGFVRILAGKPGLASLLGSGATPAFVTPTIAVDVRTASAATEAVRAAAVTPEIVAPAGGAWAWGGFSVAVQWSNPARATWTTVELRAEFADRSRKMLKPSETHATPGGPFRIASFAVPADAPLGIARFTPVVTDADGKSQEGRSIEVYLAAPGPDDVLSFDAADWANAPRPDRWRRGKAAITKDKNVPTGSYINNAAADPPVTVNFEVPKEADRDYYQAVLVAAGDIGGEALPSIGLYVDHKDQPLTQSSIGATAWHRIPIGVPVQLGAGRTMVTPHFDNDFASGPSDRNLRIEKIELYRIPRMGGAARAAASGADGMMAGAMAPAGDAMMGGETMAASGEAADMMSASETRARTPSGFFQPDDFQGLDNLDTRIGWRTVFDQLPTTGLTEVGARTVYPGADKTPAPLVTLMINGQAVSSQRSASPRFWLLPAWLTKPTNSVGLVATWPDGRVARTPEQRVPMPAQRPDSAGASAQEPAVFARYTMHDTAWSNSLKTQVKGKGDPREQRTCMLTGEADYTVNLDPAVSGRLRLHLEGKSVGPKAPLEIKAVLITDDGEKELGSVKVPTYVTTTEMGVVELPANSKGVRAVSLRFEPIKNKDGKAEQRLAFESLILVSEPAQPQPPHIDIAYWPKEPVFMTDAVVVKAEHAKGVRRIELLIDGKPTGISQQVWLEPGPFVLPLITRSLSDGEHTLAVRVHGAGSPPVDGSEVTFAVTSVAHIKPTRYQHAVHLLNRLGYGPDSRTLARALTSPPEAFLRWALAYDPQEQLAATSAGVVANPARRNDEQVINRALLGTALAANPIRERFTHFVANHFTTWVRKVDGDRQWDQHQRFLSLGIAPFGSLLQSSATSAAMLIYLDQNNSFNKRLNENYARELLELHTVGVHAGYDQHDVTTLAKLLTGWSAQRLSSSSSPGPGEVRQYEFRYDPRLNDPSEHHIFGLRLDKAVDLDPPKAPARKNAKADGKGDAKAEAPTEPASEAQLIDPATVGPDRFDRVQFMLEMLAAHPETAKFICTKLAKHYIQPQPSEALVTAMSAVYMRTGGDLAAVLELMVSSPDFQSPGSRLAHPLQFAMRLNRTSGRDDVGGIAGYLRRSRAGLFDSATPDGHPEEDNRYTDSNAMIQRWKFAREMQYQLAKLVPGDLRYAKGEFSDAERQLIIDVLAVRITGAVLSPESNSAALDLLKDTKGSRDEQTVELAAFIGQLPEVNLR